LGDGTTTNSVTPVAVSGSSVFTHLSVGRHFACATTTGTTYCWGSNYEGNIGDGTTTDRSVPTAVLTP
jgi:alpha-tubulin suppressor-like RCC1 family protein